MKGFPKWINTKQDVYNLLELYPDETKEWVRIQYEGRFVWQQVGTLALKEGAVDDGEIPLIDLVEGGIEDDTHRIIRTSDPSTSEPVFAQMELVEDPNAYIFKLLSREEIESLLDS